MALLGIFSHVTARFCYSGPISTRSRFFIWQSTQLRYPQRTSDERALCLQVRWQYRSSGDRGVRHIKSGRVEYAPESACLDRSEVHRKRYSSEWSCSQRTGLCTSGGWAKKVRADGKRLYKALCPGDTNPSTLGSSHIIESPGGLEKAHAVTEKARRRPYS